MSLHRILVFIEPYSVITVRFRQQKTVSLQQDKNTPECAIRRSRIQKLSGRGTHSTERRRNDNERGERSGYRFV